jgi:hypothetical protein
MSEFLCTESCRLPEQETGRRVRRDKRNGSTRSLVLSRRKLHDLALSPLFVCLHCLGLIISCAVRNRIIKISHSSFRVLVGGRGLWGYGGREGICLKGV